MASQKQHELQAKHNQDLLAFLENTPGGDRFDDWYITVAFYTALHHFESILPVVAPKINSKRKMGFVSEHYDTHAERMPAMQMIFYGVYGPYSSLYKRSRMAKYEKYATNPVIKSLAKKRLEEVVQECRRALDKLGK